MNSPAGPADSGASTSTPPPFISEVPVHLSRLLFGLALAVAMFDCCFWKIRAFGFSVALFFLALAGIILANRQSSDWKPMTRFLLVLLAGAAMAATLQTGVTNTLVFLTLIIALAGDTFFTRVASAWGRWLSQAVAMVRAPGRIFWLIGRLLDAGAKGGFRRSGGLAGGCLLVLPALGLVLIFGSLLASGNEVFGSWTSSFFDWFWKELALYLDAGRIILWLLVALLVLPLLRPVDVAAWWWGWTQRLPRFPQTPWSGGAVLGSGLVLIMLNLLFLVANMADLLFLWSGRRLPAGVTYSGYVHNGVNTLTFTVILSALVLTVIFQQALKVAQRRELKLLGVLWIAQNLFLLLSVLLRLKNYIEAYDMTVTRLSVMIFLVLVAIGYALLTIKITQDKSLSWLVGGSVLAVFGVFYVTQFLDLAGWTANYNVARWEMDPVRKLDGAYLADLGAPAWPAIRRAYDTEPSFSSAAHDAWNRTSINEKSIPKALFDSGHWREFSLRAWLNRRALEESNK